MSQYDTEGIGNGFVNQDRWIACVDGVSGDTYYYCESSGESRWEKPW